jgi:hypothetical protein
VPPWDRNESFLVAFAFNVAQLNWIATAKRNLSAAVNHLAAQIEILVNDDDRRAKVPRTNGGGQPGGACSDDDYIGLVVPFNGFGWGNLR